MDEKELINFDEYLILCQAFSKSCMISSADATANLNNELICDAGPILEKQTGKIATERDYSIFYSTVPRYVSYRDPENGTIFIGSICEFIRQKKTNILLDDLVKRVKEMVARDKDQVAQVVDTLVAKVYFAVSFKI